MSLSIGRREWHQQTNQSQGGGYGTLRLALVMFRSIECARNKQASSHRDRPAENLHEVLEGRFVVGVDEDQVFREQESDDVVVVLSKHWDAAETALEDNRQGLQHHNADNENAVRQTGQGKA